MDGDGLNTVADLQYELELCRNNMASLVKKIKAAKYVGRQRLLDSKLERAIQEESRILRRLARRERAK